MTRVTLRDGATVAVRPIRPDDEPGLTALYSRLSPETAYQRFFTVMRRLPPDWAHFLAHVDYERRMALVGVDPLDRLIAVVRYDYDDRKQEAEIAIVVQDAWQGKGLGTVLLNRLFEYAGRKGIRQFRAYVLSENYRMLDLLGRLTRVVERRGEGPVTSLLLEPRAPAPSEPG